MHLTSLVLQIGASTTHLNPPKKILSQDVQPAPEVDSGGFWVFQCEKFVSFFFGDEFDDTLR